MNILLSSYHKVWCLMSFNRLLVNNQLNVYRIINQYKKVCIILFWVNDHILILVVLERYPTWIKLKLSNVELNFILCWWNDVFTDRKLFLISQNVKLDQEAEAYMFCNYQMGKSKLGTDLQSEIFNLQG